MSEKEQAQQQTPSAGQEQNNREGARASQGERNASAGGEAGSASRGRSGGGGGGGGRHGRRRHGQSSSSSPQGASRRNENSLNMQELRDLMDLFTSHGLTEFEIENEEIRVRLSRNLMPLQQAAAPTEGFQTPHASAAAPARAPESAPATPATSATAAATTAPAEASRAEEKAEDLHIIPSPIVGTFYRSPSPTAEPFVKQGSHVEPDTIVCIIEAMKLMNEIQAETTGVVEKIYVENGQPVEYGQPLFGIKK
ncbi:MAG TPA: acetyl-CoA carboxylase biotin carboxyl carrier protein [Pyrinomonadaceae bacterium]|nr:acetyl-CoA carboxylase biotin carboxyl carrier protein [Pyrinomonadaceae bacterium]